MKKALVGGALAALAALILSVPSVAADHGVTNCTHTLAPGTYNAVFVPAGAVCITITGPVTIVHGVRVGHGATFVLGNENHPGHVATISGGVRSSHSASVQIHFSTISGGVNLLGGAGPFGGPFGVTFNTIEDSSIHGNVNIVGYSGFWQGFFRNTVVGSFTFNNNVVVDPDGNEVQTNTISGDMNCSGNVPAPQSGDSGGSPNVVGGTKNGQCAGV